MLRTGRKSLAAATLLGDMLKGTAAVLVAGALWGGDASLAAALGAVLGHVFPVWLGFKGGKGVATYIGVLLALAWPAVLAFAAVWAAVAAALRYSSLAGLIASAATPRSCVVAGQSAAGAAVSRPHGAVVDHAPRQHRAIAQWHRDEDRPETGGGAAFMMRRPVGQSSSRRRSVM